MPIIDGLIRQMYERGGDRLMMAPGRPVTLLQNGSEEPITTYSPNISQLERLVAEILPDGASPPDGEGRRQFRYESPEGAVEIRVRLDGEESLVMAAPAVAGENGGAPPPNPATRAEAGSPEEPLSIGARPHEAHEASAPEDAGEERGGVAAQAVPPATAQEAEPPETREAPPPSEPTRQATTPSEPTRDAIVEEVPGAPAIDRLFRKMVGNGCSDLHLSAGSAPLFRRDGEIVQLGEEPTLSPDETRRLLLEITPEKSRLEFEERKDTDFAYEIEGVARFRCNLFEDRRGMGGVFRQIPAEILTAEKLGLSPAVLKLCELKKGLVLVTGPTGSGKSTTLAAMVDYINRSRREHIITIEDPIEFVHENHSCLVNQREVGIHTASFKAALRAALREDPDIVLVGEMRDLETVQIALETAETGHLVFGTLHTNTAPTTVSRIIDQFPAGQQAQIRTMLAESLKGVIAQTLCRRKAGGRVAAMEILIVTNAVANLIREEKAYQIPSVMQTGRGAGMRTMNDALLELVRDGTVEAEEAYRNAVEKAEFKGLLERNGIRIELA